MSLRATYALVALGLAAGFIALKVGLYLVDQSIPRVGGGLERHTNPGAILYQRHHARPH
jgi:hypothetical protein